MADETINDAIQVMIDHTLSQQPTHQLATIIKTYEDSHADIKTDTGRINYVQCIGDNTVGTVGILTHLNNNLNEPVLITGGADLSELYELIGEINEYVTR